MDIIYALDFIGGIFIVAIPIYLVYHFLSKKKKRRSSDDDDVDSYVSPTVQANTSPTQCSDRLFSLTELRQAGDGRYGWDDTGSVFEVNSDGSVTVVGHFDPAELNIDPVHEMFERLNNDGLMEMLPRMWSFHAVNNNQGESDTFVFAFEDNMLSVPACPHTISEVNEVSLIPSSFEDGKSVITFILSKTADGYLTLMPSNEKEFILSLGAKACIERAFGDTVKVRISSPATMGALGVVIGRSTNKTYRISFAFGVGEDYMCCNLLADNGTFEVKDVLRNSIIRPSDDVTALSKIAKGCMALSLIRERLVDSILFIDMIPYTMSFLLKENGRVIEIFDCISEPVSIPAERGKKGINAEAGKKLSFLIGSHLLFEDIVSESGASYGNIGAWIDIDADMCVLIRITSGINEYKISVGELIG